MKTLKTLVAVLFAFACFLPYNLKALDSDVGWCGDYWGGAYVWGFEPWNLNDLHDDITDILTSDHYVGLSNASIWSTSPSWHAYLEVYIGQSPGDGTVFTQNDSGSLSIGPGQYDGEGTTLSINVQILRPGEVGIYGTTRLNCTNDWFASENLYPFFLTLGGHH